MFLEDEKTVCVFKRYLPRNRDENIINQMVEGPLFYHLYSEWTLTAENRNLKVAQAKYSSRFSKHTKEIFLHSQKNT